MPLEEAGDLFGHDETEEAIARRDVSKLLAKLPPAKRQLVRDIKLDGVSVADAAAAHRHVGIGGQGDGASRHQIAGRGYRKREAAMRTDDLIAQLSGGLEPVKTGAVTRTAAGRCLCWAWPARCW